MIFVGGILTGSVSVPNMSILLSARNDQWPTREAAVSVFWADWDIGSGWGFSEIGVDHHCFSSDVTRPDSRDIFRHFVQLPRQNAGPEWKSDIPSSAAFRVTRGAEFAVLT